MADDPKFPFYKVVFEYHECGEEKLQTTSLMRPWLYKIDPGAEAVESEARAVWPTINFRGEPKERTLVAIKVERKPDVEWALAWFAHQTFRAGRTDAELRESFERWVSRWEEFQNDLSQHPGTPCLMGAEDRWRWKDWCTCEKCLRDDIAMIAH